MTLPKISEGEVRRCSFTIPMTPIPKARARVTSRGTYTPLKTAEAEWEVRLAVLQEVKEHPHMLFGTAIPIKMDVTFYLQKPKSAPKKRILPTVKPDLDNYVKLVKDALSGYLYWDDAQICTIVAHKRYGEPPRIEVALEELMEVVG